jgi:hypothetical protein
MLLDMLPDNLEPSRSSPGCATFALQTVLRLHLSDEHDAAAKLVVPGNRSV